MKNYTKSLLLLPLHGVIKTLCFSFLILLVFLGLSTEKLNAQTVVGDFKFEESGFSDGQALPTGANLILDSSGAGNHGTVGSNGYTYQSGAGDAAPGSTQSIQTPSGHGRVNVPSINLGSNGAAWKVELWVKLNASAGGYNDLLMTQFTNQAGRGANYGIHLIGNKIQIWHDTGVTPQIGNIAYNTWTHIAITNISEVFEFFVNGVSIATAPGRFHFHGLVIGTTDEPFEGGFIDDVKITDLSATPGAALAFDGSGDYVQSSGSVNALGLTTQATWECWVYFNTLSGNQTLFDMMDYYSVNGMYINYYGGQMAYSQAGGLTQTWAPQPPGGTWTHLAVTKDGNTVTIYYNGVEQASTSNHNVSLIGSNANLELGAQSNHGARNQYLNGKMDEVRVWNRALCAEEIQAQMNCELSGSENGLVAYFQMNEGNAGQNNSGVNSAPDSSPMNYNGTLYGFSLNGTNSNWIAPGAVESGVSCAPVGSNICPPACTDPDVTISEHNVTAFCQGLVELKADISNSSALQSPITYLWSNGATTESIVVTAGGNYSVEVTEGGGCSGTDDHDVTTDAWDVLGSYVIVGYEVDIDGNTVSGGGAGVTGSGKKAKLRGGSVVNEFVKAPVIQKSGGSSAAHEEIGQVTVGLPAFKSSNYNSDDITVSSGGSMTLSGSAYGEIEVKKNATLIFSAAEIHIEDLEVEDGGTIVFSQDAELMIDDDMKLNEDCSFNTAGKFVVVYVGDRTTIDEGSDVVARIYSVDKLHVKRASSNNHTTMTGMFISDDKVDGDDYVDWNWDANCGSISSPSSIIVPEEDEFEVIDANIISSEEGLSDPSLDIFPNPARDILNIQLDNIEEGKVMIFDSRGRLVWERDLVNGQKTLSTNLDSRFQNGLYVVSVITKEHRMAKRLVISK